MTEFALPIQLRVRGGCRRAPGGGYETIKSRLKDDVTDWLAENVTGRWEAILGTRPRIIFDDIADAALFKLRWL